jgi:hypothetical protein
MAAAILSIAVAFLSGLAGGACIGWMLHGWHVRDELEDTGSLRIDGRLLRETDDRRWRERVRVDWT